MNKQFTQAIQAYVSVFNQLLKQFPPDQAKKIIEQALMQSGMDGNDAIHFSDTIEMMAQSPTTQDNDPFNTGQQ